MRDPRDPYEVVMNENKNPLQRLPKAQRFQIMVFLSCMWTTVFCLAIGSYGYWGDVITGARFTRRRRTNNRRDFQTSQ